VPLRPGDWLELIAFDPSEEGVAVASRVFGV
jgi:hypothetical protein